MTEALREPIRALELSAFDLLPAEVIVHGFSFLSPEDLCRLSQVCSIFQTIADRNEIWKPLYLQQKKIGVWIGFPPKNWKEHARRIAQLATSSSLIYWKVGYANEALRFADANHWIAAFIDSKQLPQESIDDTFMQLLKNIDGDEAYPRYLQHRVDFFKKGPLRGWWLSNLLSIKKKKDQVALPREIRRNEKDLHHFMLGCVIFWLERKKTHPGLITLNCCTELFQKFPYLLVDDDTIQENVAWRLEETISGQAAPLPVLERFVHFFNCYRPKQSIKILNKILDIVDLARQIHYADELALTICKIEDEEENAQRIISFYQKQKLDLISPQVFAALAHLIRKYSIESAYEWILTSSPDKITSEPQLYFDLIELCCRHDTMHAVVNLWTKLTALRKGEPLEDSISGEDFLKVISDLMEENDQIYRDIVALEPETAEIVVIQAYAFFLNNQVNSALIHLYQWERYVGFDLEEQLGWLSEMKWKNFKAALAYSLFLQDNDALVAHFFELFDTPTQSFFIYHNLAVRLFFEGHLEASWEYLQKALELNDTVPQSLTLKSLLEGCRNGLTAFKPWHKKKQNQLLVIPED